MHCVVTSPPYWGLRDYGVNGQLGLERTPQEYLSKMVELFREVRRALKPDGTCWVNLGDAYWTDSYRESRTESLKTSQDDDGVYSRRIKRNTGIQHERESNLKPKDLIGMPWRVAFALQEDGWWLRCDIIWAKPNPMPESVTDRPTRAHEYVFLLSKSARYHYDAAAIREEPSPALIQQIEHGYNGHGTKDFFGNGVQDASGVKGRIIAGYRKRIEKHRGHSRRHAGFNDRWDKLTVKEQMACGSNKRSVWNVAPANCKESHFATFPTELIKPMILAGCPVGGLVLDPFLGSGTTGAVAASLGRQSIGVELNPDYCAMARSRIEAELAQTLLPLS